MFVLGVDPGLSRCGYGAVRVQSDGRAIAEAAGVLRTDPSWPLPRRLSVLMADLRSLLDELSPAAVAVEKVFFQTNVRTAMSVGQASGIALALADAMGCEVAEYTANEVKSVVAGYGAATKEQVQRMVQTQLGLAEVPRPPDAADALALALTHCALGTAKGEADGEDGDGVIGSLRGQVLDRSVAGNELLVEVGGVGYRVLVPPRTLVAAGDVGEAVFLHVHTHVREDAIVLYGFATGEERLAFEALLSAHKVGPALALAILSHLTPLNLRRAVASDDIEALCSVPGVGKTTAARLVLDLKNRLALDADPEATLAALNGDAAVNGGARADVRNALANLGYAPDEISFAVNDLPDENVDASELLRSALKTLAAAR